MSLIIAAFAQTKAVSINHFLELIIIQPEKVERILYAYAPDVNQIDCYADYMISQVHRMMLAYRGGNQELLYKLVRELCPQSDAPQWRVLDFLSGHLPDGKDLADVRGLLSSAEMLRQKCKDAIQHQEGSLDFGE
ncbi:MAG: hypothetical protein IKZ48_01140 [Prevotella sp.]|nr:hypothetical protein [Prevotella sp.]